MTVAEVTRAAAAHRAEAILFTNTLPLTAAAIAGLPDTRPGRRHQQCRL